MPDNRQLSGSRFGRFGGASYLSGTFSALSGTARRPPVNGPPGPWRRVCRVAWIWLTLGDSGGDATNVSIRAKTPIERCVNATDHRCEWWLPMAPWSRMPLPPTHTCPQEPWEAQDKAESDRCRVKFSFRGAAAVAIDLERAGALPCAAIKYARSLPRALEFLQYSDLENKFTGAARAHTLLYVITVNLIFTSSSSRLCQTCTI